MKKINFCKMHGLGNDFVILDGVSQQIDSKTLPIPQWAHRQLGIGFDQLLLIQAGQQTDFSCLIFNSDGTLAEQCGNGMRCVARFIHEEKLINAKNFSLATAGGRVEAFIQDYNHIQINMGVPRFEPQAIPLLADKARKLYEIPLEDNQPGFALSALSMGNPHAILQVTGIEKFPVRMIGEKIAQHPLFPAGVNVGFMEVLDEQHIRLRTFERGAGETFACGSNACAAVVAGIINHLLASKVKVEMKYGDLWVEWAGEETAVLMTGAATRVFSGSILV